MRYFIVATILLVLSALSATAQEPQPPPQPHCAPPAVVVEGIARTHPVDKMIVLEPEQALRVGIWFDAQPPESDNKFTFAVVLKHVGGSLGLLLGRDGKVCAAFLVPDEAVPGLLQAIMGTNASALPIILVQHRPEDMDLHDRFYFSWRVPNGGNERVSSCCNRADCAPADIRRVDGHWEGRRQQDTAWVRIPENKIEANQPDPRESPDGSSHLCLSGSGAVLCAVLGAGL